MRHHNVVQQTNNKQKYMLQDIVFFLNFGTSVFHQIDSRGHLLAATNSKHVSGFCNSHMMLIGTIGQVTGSKPECSLIVSSTQRIACKIQLFPGLRVVTMAMLYSGPVAEFVVCVRFSTF
jgi:hypothetical protein